MALTGNSAKGHFAVCLRLLPVLHGSRREASSSVGDSSPSVVWKTILPRLFSVMSRPWPSRKPIDSTCSEPPAPTTSNCFCCMRIPAKLILCYNIADANRSMSPTSTEWRIGCGRFPIPRVIASVQDKMRDKKLVIADGHHRYETALNFRNECRASTKDANGEAPYEFVMMTFVNMNDPGLLVLPTHRVVHSLDSFSVDEFQRGLRAFFEVEQVDAASRRCAATSSPARSGKCRHRAASRDSRPCFSPAFSETGWIEVPRWPLFPPAIARRCPVA